MPSASAVSDRIKRNMIACDTHVGLLFLEGLRDDLRARIEGQLAQQAPRHSSFNWQRLASITTLMLSVGSCALLAFVSLRVSIAM